MFFDQDTLSVRILDVVGLSSRESDSQNQRGYHALSFRLEADTEISFRDRSIHVGSGTVGYFPANLSYRRQSVHDRMIVVHFDTDGYFSGSIEFITPAAQEQVRALFEEMLRCWLKKEAGYYYRVTGLFYELLALLRAECASREQEAFSPQLAPAMQYLEEHFTDPNLSVNTLAEAAHLSEVYFRRLFREATGLSPRHYLIRKRISYATALLESGCLSVRQVAEQAGFTDAKYFSTVFRQTVGVAPSRYLYYWENSENS